MKSAVNSHLQSDSGQSDRAGERRGECLWGLDVSDSTAENISLSFITFSLLLRKLLHHWLTEHSRVLNNNKLFFPHTVAES